MQRMHSARHQPMCELTGPVHDTPTKTIYSHLYRVCMFIRLGLMIEVESNENAIEIIKDLKNKGVLTDISIWAHNDGQPVLDVITYDEKIKFAAEYATEPNVPSDLSGEKKLIISDTISVGDPHGGTDDLDSVRFSVDNLCDLRDDIKMDTDYAVEEVIQKVAE